jgi:hypothetical protein
MNRSAVGSYSGLTLTRAKADQMATEDAEEKLEKMLVSECDVVPCPRCGALTEEMKREKARFVPMILSGLGMGALGMGFVYFAGRVFHHWFYFIGILSALLFVGTGLILICVFLGKIWELIKSIGGIFKNAETPGQIPLRQDLCVHNAQCVLCAATIRSDAQLCPKCGRTQP